MKIRSCNYASLHQTVVIIVRCMMKDSSMYITIGICAQDAQCDSTCCMLPWRLPIINSA